MAEQGGGRDEGQDPGEEFDDPFEDLDRFFTPDPNDPEPAGSAQDPGHAEEPGEELLPSDWRPDIESLDVGGAHPESTQGAEGPDAPEEPARPARGPGGEPTSE